MSWSSIINILLLYNSTLHFIDIPSLFIIGLGKMISFDRVYDQNATNLDIFNGLSDIIPQL